MIRDPRCRSSYFATRVIFSGIVGVHRISILKRGKVVHFWEASWKDRENNRTIRHSFRIGPRPEEEARLLAMHLRRKAEEKLSNLHRSTWPKLPPVRKQQYRRERKPDTTANETVAELKSYVNRCRDSDWQIAKNIDAEVHQLRGWLNGTKQPAPESVKIRRFLNARL